MAGVAVRVPATSANLGPGFDALGLALALDDEVSAEITGDRVVVTVEGEGAGELPTDERHLVVRSMYAAFDELGAPRPPGLVLTCRNRIPQARGLGSSSAAIVAGVLLARALVGGGAQRPGGGAQRPGAGAEATGAEATGAEALDDHGVLRLAARLEGHPDNVAPCLLGGFTIAWTGADGAARAVRLAPSGEVRPTVFVPSEHGLTEAARAVLPATVPHADAAHTAGRAALLVHALTAAPERLLEATEDRLHQPYRATAAPATAALVARLRAAGVAAVVSGAGPSVLAVSPVAPDFEAGDGWIRHVFEIDRRGAVVEESSIKPFAR